jgi:hypothetical protein
MEDCFFGSNFPNGVNGNLAEVRDKSRVRTPDSIRGAGRIAHAGQNLRHTLIR